MKINLYIYHKLSNREDSMALDNTATITAIVLVVIIACIFVIYAMRRGGKKPEKKPIRPEMELELRGLPFKVTKSV